MCARGFIHLMYSVCQECRSTLHKKEGDQSVEHDKESTCVNCYNVDYNQLLDNLRRNLEELDVGICSLPLSRTRVANKKLSQATTGAGEYFYIYLFVKWLHTLNASSIGH